MSAASAEASVGDWDWTRPDFQDRLYDIYRELRDHAPLARSPAGFWAVSRFEDVFAAAVDAKTFSSAQGLTMNYDEMGKLGLEKPIVMMDPPEHTSLRKLARRRSRASS